MAAAAEAAVRLVEPVMEPAIFEILLPAVVATVAAGLAVVDAKRPVTEPFEAALFGVVEVTALVVGFGGVEVVDTAGLRAAAAVVGVVLLAELLDGSMDDRLAVPAIGFFSSTDEADLCEAALDDVAPVALVAGFLAIDPATGLVGGLLSPPVVVRETDDVGVVFAVDVVVVADFVLEVAEDPRRFAGTAARFGTTLSFLTATFLGLGVSFSVSVSTSETSPVVSSPAVSVPDASCVPSSCTTTSLGSVSAIFLNFNRISRGEIPHR